MAGHVNGCYFAEAIPLDFLFFEITDADQTATRVIKWSPSLTRLYSRLCENPFPGPEEAGVRGSARDAFFAPASLLFPQSCERVFRYAGPLLERLSASLRFGAVLPGVFRSLFCTYKAAHPCGSFSDRHRLCIPGYTKPPTRLSA